MDLLKQSGLIFLFLIKSFQITLLILNYYNLLYFLNNQLLNYSLNYNYSISANLVFFLSKFITKDLIFSEGGIKILSIFLSS
jgi:hypothetical protein